MRMDGTTTRLLVLPEFCTIDIGFESFVYSIKNAPNKGLKFFYMRGNLLPRLLLVCLINVSSHLGNQLLWPDLTLADARPTKFRNMPRSG